MQGAVWGRTWGKVAAIVALAHLLVVLYVLLGSKRGAASMTGLFSGRAGKPHALGHGASLDANASMWHPQVTCLSSGKEYYSLFLSTKTSSYRSA